ncbi:hypothetical protein E2C01_067509 [Portunus trituberculatus]|uniref:Uncharacterized protein n=1 Tax=Portunus trituberculatus TaxID=210409 RepID=A0A5B7HL74_PORTR|nr:hypothetical protein [Portunus trituberculatus]
MSQDKTLQGAETLVLINRLTDILISCDHWMLRYVAGVRWHVGRSSSEVTEMCGDKDLSVELRKKRLRWTEGGVLSEVEEVRVGGQWPVGRPKKR